MLFSDQNARGFIKCDVIRDVTNALGKIDIGENLEKFRSVNDSFVVSDIDCESNPGLRPCSM